MPTAEPKPLAKSLHTVTVLARVTRAIWSYREGYSLPDALDTALHHLELDGKPDPYGLREAALKQLEN